MNRLVVLTGPSGSGLSSAKYSFEETGFYVVENPPLEVMEDLLLSFKKMEKTIHNFCVILNISIAKKCIKILKKDNSFKTKVVLLMASEGELIKRYALTRHAHVRSVMENIPLEKAIEEDIADADELAPDADATFNTSSMSVKMLRQFINQFINVGKNEKEMIVNFVSFGFKNGTPSGLDMVFDVRSMPNPFWVEELKELTGYDQKVIDYMKDSPLTKTLLHRIVTFLSSQLAEMQNSGRTSYNVGIACSGGQHRSTYVAKYLKDYFSDTYHTNVIHRDTPSLNERE